MKVRIKLNLKNNCHLTDLLKIFLKGAITISLKFFSLQFQDWNAPYAGINFGLSSKGVIKLNWGPPTQHSVSKNEKDFECQWIKDFYYFINRRIIK